VRDADPQLAVRDVRPLVDVLGASLAARRFALAMVAAFALVALTLAAVGVYGVLAFAVTSRTREFGVRLTLGATRRSVLLLVVRQGITWSLLGVAIGGGAALAAGRLLDGMLYAVAPTDPTTLVAVVVVLLTVVLAACLAPAARATRVDPARSVRTE
jgi:ABC-type antimicrobial peptide transport system permease subunit